jgi:hypothetical protein
VLGGQVQERRQRRAAFDDTGGDELRDRQQLDLRLLRIKRGKGEHAVRRAEVDAKDVLGHMYGERPLWRS